MRELRQRAKVVDLLAAEPQIEQVIDRLRQSRGDREIAIARKPAEKQLEYGRLTRLAGLEISSRHRELVQVGQQTGHENECSARALHPAALTCRHTDEVTDEVQPGIRVGFRVRTRHRSLYVLQLSAGKRARPGDAPGGVDDADRARRPHLY